MAAVHPDAMKPKRRRTTTRTAPAMAPPGWWTSHPRYRAYVLFGLVSVVFLLVPLAVVCSVWQLGEGPRAWQSWMEGLRSPVSVLLHGIALPLTVWYGVRFFRLFPKSQPPRIELPFLPPALRKRPPLPAIAGAIYAGWAVVTVLLLVVLGGIWP